jgi:hypothetical protein
MTGTLRWSASAVDLFTSGTIACHCLAATLPRHRLYGRTRVDGSQGPGSGHQPTQSGGSCNEVAAANCGREQPNERLKPALPALPRPVMTLRSRIAPPTRSCGSWASPSCACRCSVTDWAVTGLLCCPPQRRYTWSSGSNSFGRAPAPRQE